MTERTPNTSDPLALTILTHAQPFQTKQFVFDAHSGETQKKNYGKGRNFKFYIRQIKDIHDLEILMKELEQDPHSFVVRGKPVNGIDLSFKHPRLLHAKPDTPATLEDTPRQWLMIDIDGLAAPPLCDPVFDLEDAAEAIRGVLPPEFHDTKIYVSFSGSQSVLGIGKDDALSAHVWALIDVPKSSAELKRWAKWVNEKTGHKLFDPAVFQPIQAHYTAAPIFMNMLDPLPVRGILLEGEYDFVTLQMPDDYWQPTGRYTASNTLNNDTDIGVGFEAHISRAGGPDGIRGPIVSAVAAMVYGTGGGVDHDYIKQTIRTAIAAHNFPFDMEGGCRAKSDADHYLADDHLSDIINWCVEREREQRPSPAPISAEEVNPTYPDTSVSLEDARKELEMVCTKFFEIDIPAYELEFSNYLKEKAKSTFLWPDPPIMPAMGIKISTGGGKTYQAFQQAARYVFRRLNEGVRVKGVIFVPLHTLADEHAEAFEARSRELIEEAKHKGLKAAVYRSRLAFDPNEDRKAKMCADPERVKAIRSINGNVDLEACGSKNSKCPLFDDCSFQKMKSQAKNANILIMPHQSMFHPSPILTFADPNFVIIDEDFHDAGVNLPDEPENQISVSTFLSHRFVITDANDKSLTADLLAYSNKLVKALAECVEGNLRRGYLERAGLTADICHDARNLEWNTRQRTGIKPGMPLNEVRERVQKCSDNSTIMIKVRIWELLADFLFGCDDECVNLSLAKDQKLPNNLGSADFVKVGWRANIHSDFIAPTLALDATMSEAVVKPYLSSFEFGAEIRIQQDHVYVRQVIDTKMPNRSLVATPKASDKSKKERQKLTNKIRRYIEFEAARYEGKGKSVSYINHLTNKREEAKIDILVASTKPVFDDLIDGWCPPDGVDVTYYARTIGSNRWQHVAKIILIGRTEAPVRSAETKAAIIQGCPVQTIRPDNKGNVFYEKSQGGILRRDGQVVSIESPGHPDETVEEVRSLITEGKLLQALGRGRGVMRRADDPLAIDILTSIPLPIVVDETLKLIELLPDKFDLMAMCGFMPGNRRAVAGCYPELFANEDAVHSATRANSYNKGGRISHRDIYMGKSPPLSITLNPESTSAEQAETLLNTRFFYRVEGEPAGVQTCYIRRHTVGIDDALKLLTDGIGKPVILAGDPEWLPGQGAVKRAEAPTIDCDPAPLVIELTDEFVYEKFSMNRKSFQTYKRAMHRQCPEDEQERKLHQINAISAAIGKPRMMSVVEKLSDVSSEQ